MSGRDERGRSPLHPGAWLPRLDTQATLLLVATATWGIHVATETSFRTGHATTRERLEPLVVVLVLSAAALVACARPGWLGKASIASLIGVLAATNGGIHVYDLTVGREGTAPAMSGPSAATVVQDVGGLASLLAGLWLLGLAIVLMRRRRAARRSTSASLWRRGVRALAAIATALALSTLVVFPVVLGTVQTHRLRHTPAGAVPAGYRAVHFVASDGVQLSGWYHPTRNGAAVLLVPSASGTRDSVRAHAHLLVRHGYGVLAYDARGSGASDGGRNAYGWGWRADVTGGVRFLSTRRHVQPEGIGAIGLSTGADVLIETAATLVPGESTLSATVMDGATARSSGDLAPLEHSPTDMLGDLPLRLTFGVISLLSGTSPGEPLRHLAGENRRHRTPILLIAAGSIPQEIPLSRRYAKAAHAPLWTLPGIAHTRGIHDAAGYEDRVVGFLDHALLGRPAARTGPVSEARQR